MLPSLFNSINVKKSLTRLSFKIKMIRNVKAKERCYNLLEKLKEQIILLEQAHRIRSTGELRPNLFSYQRENIYKIRKEIEKILKENHV